MTSQPLWEQIKSARISRSGLIGLGVGIGLGLILGLLVGWVWWPVEWQGSGIGDMAPSAQMDYMATVAEAYAGSGTPAAADRAAARLAQLGPVTAERLLAAMEYFAAQPGSSEQVRNLVTLSIALGQPVDVAANPLLAAAIQPPAAPGLTGASSADETADAPPAQVQDQGSGVNGWAVILLFALLLGAGGAYILYLARKNRSAEASATWTPTANDEVGGFAEEADYPNNPAASSSGFERSDLRQPAATTPAAPAAGAGRSYNSRGYSTVHTSPPVSGPPVYTEAGFDPEDDFGAAAKTSSAYLARAADEHAPEALGAVAAEETEAATVVIAPPPPKVVPPPRPVTPSRFARYKTIDAHSAEFHAGMANVDFMRNIEEAGAGRYLGEYGMFVHERNGLLNGNMEEVIAFEVTLIDKADEQPALTTLARTLLSEYANDKFYAKFANEAQSGGAPIIAQQGTSFALEGRQLLLECTIAAVTYNKDGIFRSLKLDMVLKRKE